MLPHYFYHPIHPIFECQVVGKHYWLIDSHKGTPENYVLWASFFNNNNKIKYHNLLKQLTTPKSVYLLPLNPFNEVLDCSSLKLVILILSNVDLNRMSTELHEHIKLLLNSLLTTLAFITRASSFGYNTLFSLSFVYMFRIWLVLVFFIASMLNTTSRLVIAYLS